jgi:hypothetical protein
MGVDGLGKNTGFAKQIGQNLSKIDYKKSRLRKIEI